MGVVGRLHFGEFAKVSAGQNSFLVNYLVREVPSCGASMDYDDNGPEYTSDDVAATWKPIPLAESHCGYWVGRADRRLTKTLARLLFQCGIIASEWMALRVLYSPQWPHRRATLELGEMIGMSKGGASKLVVRLIKKGLVEKRQEEFDRRYRAVRLTPEGRVFVARLAAVIKDTDREFFRPLGNKRKYRLRKWMTRVLNDGHLRRTNDWMSERMKQHGIARVDPDAGARAEAEREAKAEALWDYFKRCGEATAHGRPQPPMPASLLE